MEFDDLRGFIEIAGALGEVKKIEKADWNLEIGALTEIEAENYGPLLVFDNIPGYPPSRLQGCEQCLCYVDEDISCVRIAAKFNSS